MLDANETVDTVQRNIELKAVDPDPARTLTVCRSLQATDWGVIEQRDTYFNVSRGALKLREESPGRPHLIQYSRPDQAHERASIYRIIPVDDPDQLCTVLSVALGIRVTVEKRRHVLLWKQVRIHLDDVAGLGQFIELEAVAPPDSDLSGEHRLIAWLRAALALTDDRLCPEGYADLLRT